ncbi:MAG: DUF2510 domain-containing protein [Mycobacteriaceae bacterium]|nr:DUF2510 domain-containing protein [Mycobacteriaceae bacterium]
MVMVVFVCVAAFGLLLTASGFVFKFAIGWYAGLPAGWSAGVAPGWYPDPQSPAVVRYFDGRMWTASTQPRH